MILHGIFLKHNYICHNIFCNHFCFYFIIDDRKFDYPDDIKNVTEGHPRVGDRVRSPNMSNMSPNSQKSHRYNPLLLSVTNTDRFRLLVIINLRSTFLINSKKTTNIMCHVYLLFGTVTLSSI